MHQRNEAGLYRDPDLQIALNQNFTEAWAQRYYPGFAHAMQFLEDSRAARDAESAQKERQQREALHRAWMFSGAVTILLIIAAILGLNAHRLWLDAQRQKQIAVERGTALGVSEANLKVELGQLVGEQKNTQREKDQKEKANQELQRALQGITETNKKLQESNDELQNEAMGARQQLNGDQETISSLADSLTSQSNPLLSIYALNQKASALTLVGDHQAALQTFNSILEKDPNNLPARLNRAYEYLLVGQAAESARDSQEYLKADPRSEVALLNLAIAKAILGDYQGAVHALQESINTYDPSSGIYESDVLPDIQAATHRKLMVEEGWQYLLGLKYELAVLAAAQGDKDFPQSLMDAESAAKGYPKSVDPPLLALNWAWLQYRDRPADYGLLAASGALWEQVASTRPQFKGCARKQYLRFQEEYNKDNTNRHRYEWLDAWVANRLAQSSSNDTCLLAQGNGDPKELELEARELRSRVLGTDKLQLKIVERKLTQAIEVASANPRRNHDLLVGLLMRRAEVRYEANDMVGVRADAHSVLQLNGGVARAYYYLAEVSTEAAAKRRYYETALRYRSLDARDADRIQRLPGRQGARLRGPRRGLEANPNRDHIRPYWYDLYEREAKLQNSLGDYESALASVQMAISRNPDLEEIVFAAARYRKKFKAKRAYCQPSSGGGL